MLSYGRQNVSDADVEAVARVLRSDWLTQGPMVERFEQALAEAAGAQHAVACNSGTAALHLAAMSAELGPGQAAIVPAVTFLSTANAVRMTGADVIFADVDPDTGRMTPGTLEEALAAAGGSTRAVFPVHLGGAATDMEGIAKVAEKAGARVIEDACHALGGLYPSGEGGSVPVGACFHSQMACFSFHPVKPVTTAEGGAVTTNDGRLAKRMRSLRSHGMQRKSLADRRTPGGARDPWSYEMHEIGWNYRLSDVHCALGLSQLSRLQEFRDQRARLSTRYERRLSPLAPTVRPSPQTQGVVSGHHLFVVLVEFEAAGMERPTVMEALRARGVGTQVHYIPVPWQPYYERMYGRKDYPGAAAYYARCLTLPLHTAMDIDDVDRVVDALAQTLRLA